jgi:two-component system OmpR family sensor kinase
VLAYLLIICVAFLVVATSLIRLVGEYLFSQKVREEQRVTENLAVQFSGYLSQSDAVGLYREARSASGDTTRVMVVDALGVVQADGYSKYNGRRLELGEVAASLTEREAAYGYYRTSERSAGWIEYAEDEDGQMVGVYTAPILSAGGELTGAVVYSTMTQDVYRSLTQMQRQMAVWLLLVAAAVLILSLMVSRFFTRPIDELSQGISRMTQGDLTSRVTVRGKNEFAQLAEAFNMMCERLERLDQSRNQFVSNASHELKTPLSTMKILSETLLYQEGCDPEIQREFLTDINREIDRLSSIIGDLLTLVHLDDRGVTKLQPTLLSLEKLVQESARRLRPLAESRDIELELSIRDQIETMGDQRKLEQVFYNLIDNAVKYTPDGGKVRIEVARAGKKAVVRVSDTGIGIPKTDQIHVFDRFYRVDKARSRDTGGTGLGLAIVKQIVLLHEGGISVASEEDKGSTFTVELPIINLQYIGG